MIKFWIFLILAPVALCVNLLLGLHPEKNQKPGIRRAALFKHRLLIVLLGFALAVYSLFFINTPGLINDEGLQLAKYAVPGRASPAENQAYKFISDNFLFIDDSFNKTLIPYGEGTDDDSTSVVITNRRALIQLFNNINRHRYLLDFVVVDLSFSESTPLDNLLKKELDTLYSMNKLILSGDASEKNAKAIRFPDDAYGNVREKGNDFAYTSHTIKGDSKYLSLPYKMYFKFDGLSAAYTYFGNTVLIEDKNNSSHLCLNIFAPKFYLLNEPDLYNEVSPNNDTHQRGMPVQNLGFAVTSQGTEVLNAEIAQRKKAHLKNIIFIGAFNSPDEDIHETGYGKLHGPGIILNVFYALHLMQHRISFWFFLYLLVGFSVIIYILLSCVMDDLAISHPTVWLVRKLRKLKEKLEMRLMQPERTTRNNSCTIVKKGLKRLGMLIMLVLVDEIQYPLLLAFFFITGRCFNFILNWQILLIYFIAFEKVLKYIGKKELEEHANEKIKNSYLVFFAVLSRLGAGATPSGKR
jgi:hypothetical protein